MVICAARAQPGRVPKLTLKITVNVLICLQESSSSSDSSSDEVTTPSTDNTTPRKFRPTPEVNHKFLDKDNSIKKLTIFQLVKKPYNVFFITFTFIQ